MHGVVGFRSSSQLKERGGPIAWSTLAGFGAALLQLVACGAPAPTDVTHEYPTPLPMAESDGADKSLRPLPESLDLDPRKVALGERLYADPRLSGDARVSCVGCHDLDKGGAAGASFSDLPDRQPVDVNVPTIFNLAFDFRFAWNGRFREVGEQIDVAMENARAMAGSWKQARTALASDGDLARDFAGTYPEGLTEGSIRDAVVTYCLSLITPGSRFDRYLAGAASLSPQELNGLEMFRNYGCVSCHQGVNVGGNMFQRFGVMDDYIRDRGSPTTADLGLFNHTQDERDRQVFRVPSLRNVALTAPYFHDASAPTLEHAVRIMARYQLGRSLEDEEVADIAAFLRSLTGTYRGKPL